MIQKTFFIKKISYYKNKFKINEIFTKVNTYINTEYHK